jgi:hypothetical protein
MYHLMIYFQFLIELKSSFLGFMCLIFDVKKLLHHSLSHIWFNTTARVTNRNETRNG